MTNVSELNNGNNGDISDQFIERDKNYILERCLFRVIVMHAEKQRMEKNELARMAFTQADPKKKINLLVKSERDDPTKMQRLTVRDASALVGVLGLRLADAMWDAENLARTIEDPASLDVIEFWDKDTEED